MNLFVKLFKIIQATAHSVVSKFEDPVKLTERGIRDLKKDFDSSMKNVAQIKAIAIGVKKDIASKTQIAKDYEQKALIILKKAKAGELDEKEGDRLAGEALKKKQEALNEVAKLSEDAKNYDKTLQDMEKKVLDLKNQIQKWENEYKTLKARAIVAKTTKKVNKQLSTLNDDTTTSMLEDMKNKIQEEENLALAYSEVTAGETSIDDEINKAIGVDANVQAQLSEMKQNLLANPDKDGVQDEVEKLKKELDS